jgi:dihydroorotate dehydrogenase
VYKLLLKPLFFLLSPERAHYTAMNALQLICRIPGVKATLRSYYTVSDPSLETEVAGLKFKNPVGLAAGFDKDARWLDALECLGFGFIEIGTVTPLPQAGNAKPRLFRLPKDKALINRMGFNNAGVDEVAQRLRGRKRNILIGGNIGKNKSTPNENAVADYVKCFHALREVVDYFVVNVSSPNTPGLRELQEKAPLLNLLLELQSINVASGTYRPIFLKIAPDLSELQLSDIIDITLESGIAGLIATNTTLSRDGLQTPSSELTAIGAGGLSGKPITERATEVIQFIHARSGGRIPIIGVGGIFSARDVQEKKEAGASLFQVYTGFIYEGPSIARRINRVLTARA